MRRGPDLVVVVRVVLVVAAQVQFESKVSKRFIILWLQALYRRRFQLGF